VPQNYSRTRHPKKIAIGLVAAHRKKEEVFNRIWHIQDQTLIIGGGRCSFLMKEVVSGLP